MYVCLKNKLSLTLKRNSWIVLIDPKTKYYIQLHSNNRDVKYGSVVC